MLDGAGEACRGAGDGYLADRGMVGQWGEPVQGELIGGPFLPARVEENHRVDRILASHEQPLPYTSCHTTDRGARAMPFLFHRSWYALEMSRAVIFRKC